MISVEEAVEKIQNTTLRYDDETIDIAVSHSRVLAQDIMATRDQPPFNRVMMDGIAIDSKSKLNIYKIESIQAAGSKQLELKESTSCIEVMTGAPLPLGCDCVIPYEKVEISKDKKTVSIDISDIEAGRNIHKQGSDYSLGEVVLRLNKKITTPVIATLASQGVSKVNVYKIPKVAIISTGTELVELDRQIQPHQIFMSNSYAIESELKAWGFYQTRRLHISDNKEATEKEIQRALNDFDMLIITGGVSKGKYDFIPEVLEKLNVNNHFHRVTQKPGKPFWYGTKKEKQVFALPGNPISCLVCLRRYVIPTINKLQHLEDEKVIGEISHDISISNELTNFIPVKLKYSSEGKIEFSQVSTNNSGDFNSLSHSDGFIELPIGVKEFKKGETFEFFNWKN